MIYGYLRVSSDEQDVNSQRQGVDAFAQARGWAIDKYISDEGVSGGKDPDKRNLGPLLKRLKNGDIVICSEISRLGRDLYMVMDILHFCMTQGCVIYTVKDNFTLGDDIQSKVLAFAFGLAAEIERQMIRQRTKEGLRLRMRMGSLVGRPYSRDESYLPTGSSPIVDKLAKQKEAILEQFRWGVPLRRLAANFGADRNTIYRYLVDWGGYDGLDQDGGATRRERLRAHREKEARRNSEKYRTLYKETPYDPVPLDREKTLALIRANMTLPEIAEQFPEYTYEQVYDTFMTDKEYNTLYRQFGQKRCVKKK